MIVSISYYNEAIQVSSKTIWTTQMTSGRPWCTEFPYIMTIQCKGAYATVVIVCYQQMIINIYSDIVWTT